jgi:charged multivesicular body protein 6
MLGGRISNQDEDEVEDELEALAGEVSIPRQFIRISIRKLTDQVNGVKLPAAPTEELPQVPASEPELDATTRQKARARAREQAARTPAEPLLA